MISPPHHPSEGITLPSPHKIGWDIDGTLIKSRVSPAPIRISIDDDPYLNPCIKNHLDKIQLKWQGVPFL